MTLQAPSLISASQDTEFPVKFEFQRNSEQVFSTSMSHPHSAADLLASELFASCGREKEKVKTMPVPLASSLEVVKMLGG